MDGGEGEGRSKVERGLLKKRTWTRPIVKPTTGRASTISNHKSQNNENLHQKTKSGQHEELNDFHPTIYFFSDFFPLQLLIALAPCFSPLDSGLEPEVLEEFAKGENVGQRWGRKDGEDRDRRLEAGGWSSGRIGCQSGDRE